MVSSQATFTDYSLSDQRNIWQINPNYEIPLKSPMPKELTLDYTEISSIHPLPLWALLATDHEISDQFP